MFKLQPNPAYNDVFTLLVNFVTNISIKEAIDIDFYIGGLNNEKEEIIAKTEISLVPKVKYCNKEEEDKEISRDAEEILDELLKQCKVKFGYDYQLTEMNEIVTSLVQNSKGFHIIVTLYNLNHFLISYIHQKYENTNIYLFDSIQFLRFCEYTLSYLETQPICKSNNNVARNKKNYNYNYKSSLSNTKQIKKTS